MSQCTYEMWQAGQACKACTEMWDEKYARFRDRVRRAVIREGTPAGYLTREERRRRGIGRTKGRKKR